MNYGTQSKLRAAEAGWDLAYRQAGPRCIFRRYFPNAIIVADRFHVIRLVNQLFLKAWQDHDPEGRKNRGLLSLMRRHQWRLSQEQRDNLGHYLGTFPVLKALYEAKQRLNRLLLLKTLTRKRAKTALPKLLGLIKQLHASPLRALNLVDRAG